MTRKRPDSKALATMAKTMTKAEMATATGVSIATVGRWLADEAIALPAGNPNTNGRRRGNPKRVSWLDEDGEAPPMRPDVKVVAGPAFVVTEARPKKAKKLPKVTRLCELPASSQVVVQRMVLDFKAWLEFRRERVL